MTRLAPAAGLAAAGTAIALLCIWLATGWLDGFHRGDTRWLGWKFVSLAPWALGTALVMGALIRLSFGPVLQGNLLGLFVSITRAFLVFPLYGFVLLVGGLLCGAAAALLWGLSRLLRLIGITAAERMRPRAELYEWLALPLWMVLFPLQLTIPDEVSRSPAPELESLRRRLLWLLPVLVPFIFLWTDAVSEDTGERVDPFWIAAASAYWLSDLLIVALQVVPRLRARAKRAESRESPAHEAPDGVE